MGEIFSDMKKIGAALIGFGLCFLILGVFLLFDSGLLAIGNILFIVGVICLIGLTTTFKFFFQVRKAKGTITFFVGIITVLLKWPIIGMCIETYGFILLFKGFFPSVILFLSRLPVISYIFELPIINKFVDYYAGDIDKILV